MCSHMLGQVAGLGKSFSTLLATIWFFSSVCSHMLGQVAGLGEFSSTLLATKWFFSSVCSNVRGQGVGLGKSLPTLLARIRFCFSVCSHMLGQVTSSGKFFSVTFYVFGETRVFWKVFFALIRIKLFCVSCRFCVLCRRELSDQALSNGLTVPSFIGCFACCFG